MHAKLTVVDGRATRNEVELSLPITVGRGDDVDLTVAHHTVSRKHCELLERDGAVVVRDTGSLNGTFVGDERITEAELRPGDRLTIGPLIFRVDYQPAVSAAVVAEPEPQAETPAPASADAADEADDFELLLEEEIEPAEAAAARSAAPTDNGQSNEADAELAALDLVDESDAVGSAAIDESSLDAAEASTPADDFPALPAEPAAADELPAIESAAGPEESAEGDFDFALVADDDEDFALADARALAGDDAPIPLADDQRETPPSARVSSTDETLPAQPAPTSEPVEITTASPAAESESDESDDFDLDDVLGLCDEEGMSLPPDDAVAEPPEPSVAPAADGPAGEASAPSSMEAAIADALQAEVSEEPVAAASAAAAGEIEFSFDEDVADQGAPLVSDEIPLADDAQPPVEAGAASPATGADEIEFELEDEASAPGGAAASDDVMFALEVEPAGAAEATVGAELDLDADELMFDDVADASDDASGGADVPELADEASDVMFEEAADEAASAAPRVVEPDEPRTSKKRRSLFSLGRKSNSATVAVPSAKPPKKKQGLFARKPKAASAEVQPSDEAATAAPAVQPGKKKRSLFGRKAKKTTAEAPAEASAAAAATTTPEPKKKRGLFGGKAKPSAAPASDKASAASAAAKPTKKKRGLFGRKAKAVAAAAEAGTDQSKKAKRGLLSRKSRAAPAAPPPADALAESLPDFDESELLADLGLEAEDAPADVAASDASAAADEMPEFSATDGTDSPEPIAKSRGSGGGPPDDDDLQAFLDELD